MFASSLDLTRMWVNTWMNDSLKLQKCWNFFIWNLIFYNVKLIMLCDTIGWMVIISYIESNKIHINKNPNRNLKNMNL